MMKYKLMTGVMLAAGIAAGCGNQKKNAAGKFFELNADNTCIVTKTEGSVQENAFKKTVYDFEKNNHTATASVYLPTGLVVDGQPVKFDNLAGFENIADLKTADSVYKAGPGCPILQKK